MLKRRFSRGKEAGRPTGSDRRRRRQGTTCDGPGGHGEVGVDGVDAVGLAKMRVQAAPRSAEIERSEERVFLPGQSNPVILKRNSNALFLLQRVRDEAHRFAITHHREAALETNSLSALDRIPGIGGARKRALCAPSAASSALKRHRWKMCSSAVDERKAGAGSARCPARQRIRRTSRKEPSEAQAQP